jgi:sterol desaturase/sphingolipid hydroxylase (fatty acid hydroxylase superfamily)
MAQQIQKKPLTRLLSTGFTSHFYLYPLLIIGLLLLALLYWHSTWWHVLLLYVGGFLLWGLLEYWTHRFAFHHLPGFKQAHTLHHEQPKWRLALPYFIVIPCYLALACLLAKIMGGGNVSALFAGIISGYLSYLIVHHQLHSKRILPGTFWYRYKRFHDKHHFQQNINFGSTWQLWDRIFGTHKGQ